MENMTQILSEVKKPPKKIEDRPPPNPMLPEDAAGIIKPELSGGYIRLPIEPFLKFIPKSLLQQHTPENEEKVTRLFLRMAELYKKYIEKKRSQAK